MPNFIGLPPEVAQEILLGKDERIVFAANAAQERLTSTSSAAHKSFALHRYLIVTNTRIMYVERTSKRYDIVHSIPLEKIRATHSTSRFLGKVAVVTISWEGTSGEMDRVGYAWNYKLNPLAPRAEDAKNSIDDWIKRRLEEIEKEKTRGRVHYVIDFSFLKAQIEKGGIVLSTVKCPNCAAAVSLPDSGNLTKCGHCGATIRAVDLFDKLKGLIGT